MNRIIYVGLDVHSTTFSACAAELHGNKIVYFAETKFGAGASDVDKYLKNIKKNQSDDCEFVIGYEAGCLGFSLYTALRDIGIECKILAPTTMAVRKGGKRVKTDTRDARDIANNLAYGTCSFVHVPTAEDCAVRDYIRMRDDHQELLKRVKQQINALALRHGFHYEQTKWTAAHLKQLREFALSDLERETLDEYLATMQMLSAKIKAFDERIEELSHKPDYEVRVSQLACLCGITRKRATSIITEVCDFNRFAKPSGFAAFVGLTPGEDSSGETVCRTPITKAGNTHVRLELVEAAQSICRGCIGYKSKALAARQKGNDSKVIAYADKANERLRRKYYRMIQHGKSRNVAVTAVARELGCFICGMMKDFSPAAAA